MTLYDSFIAALALLFSLDGDFWRLVAVSFSVSLQAIVYTAIPAFALAWALAFTNFFAKRILIIVLNALLAVPTVVIGLLVYLLLSSQGPLADLQWLFSQKAMIVGQSMLCFPIITVLSFTALRTFDSHAEETLYTLGASLLSRISYVFRQSRVALLSALLVAFSRVIAEVGISLMVGGSILNHTRNITTSIVLETGKGNFAHAIALGLVLLILSLAVSALVHRLQ